MADEKLNTGSGEEKLPEAPAPVAADEPQAPAPEQTAAPTPQQEGPAQPEPGDVVVSFDKINTELIREIIKVFLIPVILVHHSTISGRKDRISITKFSIFNISIITL